MSSTSVAALSRCVLALSIFSISVMVSRADTPDRLLEPSETTANHNPPADPGGGGRGWEEPTSIAGVAADLSITKTDGVAAAAAGGSVTYTIVASNASAIPAIGAAVADAFPAILICTWTCTGAGGGTCTAAGSGNINDSVNLPAGASVTYTASCTLSASAADTGSVSNTATISLADDPNGANNSATDTDTLRPPADLSVSMSDGVIVATPGGSVNYSIFASNAGPGNASGATLTDTFPAACTSVSYTSVAAGGATGNLAAGSGSINDTLNLPAGSSVTYSASCSISAAATGSLENTVRVGFDALSLAIDPHGINNKQTDIDILTPLPNLAITKSDGVTTAIPGEEVTYTIVAFNGTALPAIGAAVADAFPDTLTCKWTCAGENGGTCAAAGDGDIDDSVDLPVGASVTYTASCILSSAATGSLSNTATVTLAGGNDSATDTDTLTPQADLAITKTDGVTTATAGGTVTYIIVASNAGPSDAPGSTVTDDFPTVCTWACAGADGGTCTATGSGDLSDTVDLPSGGRVTYTANCALSPLATGSLSNTATTSTGAGVTDPSPGNNSATDTDTIIAPGGPLPPSGTKTLTSTNLPDLEWRLVWINNRSNAPWTTRVTDVIPAGTTYTGSLVCSAQGSSKTASCTYDSGSNRILWQGSIGADLGAPNEGTAANEVVITFRTAVATGVEQVTNQASALVDTNGDGSFTDEDPNSAGATSNLAVWNQGGAVIPTVSTLGLAALFLLLAGAGWWIVRRRSDLRV